MCNFVFSTLIENLHLWHRSVTVSAMACKNWGLLAIKTMSPAKSKMLRLYPSMSMPTLRFLIPPARSFTKMLKSVGDNTQPCLTPSATLNLSVVRPGCCCLQDIWSIWTLKVYNTFYTCDTPLIQRHSNVLVTWLENRVDYALLLYTWDNSIFKKTHIKKVS